MEQRTLKQLQDRLAKATEERDSIASEGGWANNWNREIDALIDAIARHPDTLNALGEIA